MLEWEWREVMEVVGYLGVINRVGLFWMKITINLSMA